MKFLRIIFAVILAILITIILPNFSFAATEINTVLLIKEAIATWYYIIRFIAVAVMLVVLIFIGIKIALSNIASDRAFYQRMLMDWVAGMVLVFGIHYIMLFILELNQTIVNTVASVGEEIYEADPAEYGGLDYKEKDNEDIESSIFETVRTRAYDPKLINGTMGMIMYIYLVYYAYKFTFIYLKRYLMVGILTLMAPAVAVSYAFTKVLTGKTKIFSTWLKEYFFNVILQSIHAIIYVTFVMSALKLSLNSLSGMLLSFILLNFMSKADKIFRTIFAIGGGGSLVDDLNNLVEKKPSELADDIRNIGTAYLGNKAIRQLAKKEREFLFFKPAQKAFGGAMAFRANHSKPKDKYEVEHEDGTKETTEFLQKDIDRFADNEKLNSIIDLENEIEELKLEQMRKKEEAKKKEEELKLLIAKKLEAEEKEEDTRLIEADIQAKEAELEALTHEKEIYAKQQELEVKMDQFSRSKEAIMFAMKEKFRNALDYEKYTEKVVTRKGKEKYVGVRDKYIVEQGKRKKIDGISMRMKQYINAQSILGCTEEDKKLLKENMGELKDVTLGFFKGLFSLALFIDSPVLATGIGASSYVNANNLLSSYLAKNKVSYIDPSGVEIDKALTVANIMFLRRAMSKQLNDAKDEYIVNSINKKHKKFVRLLTKGVTVATTGVVGAKYIRNFSPQKSIPKNAVVFKTGGFGYTEREHAIHQFYKQDELNRKVEKIVLGETQGAALSYRTDKELEGIHTEIESMSVDDTIKQFAEMTALAVAVNGIYIPTTDKELDENTILNMYEQNAENLQQDTSVPETNPDKTPLERQPDIEEGEKSTVTVQGKTIQITDKQIEDIIVNVAKDNNYKSVTEFTTNEKESHKIICQKIEEELIQKQIKQSGNADISKEEIKIAMSAIDEKIEKGKAKIVVGEITTKSFEEAIKENGTTEVEKIEVGIVTEKAEKKLQEWVKSNNEQIQERNPALQQLQNMKKNLSAESNTQLPDTRAKQTILGEKSIEQVMNKAVQARYRSVSKFNGKSSNNGVSEENTKKLKEKLEERRVQEFQQLLVDTLNETSEERLQALMESVPTRQAEVIYLTKEIQNNNMLAKDMGMKKRAKKHLQFETRDTSSVVDSLNKLSENDRSIQDTYDSSVRNTYDSRVREQDTRVESPNTRGENVRRIKTITEKIDPKQISSAEGPIIDLNELIANMKTKK